MTQLEKAREEIRRNTILISFNTDRVMVHCDKCNGTGKIKAITNFYTPCPECITPFPFNRP